MLSTRADRRSHSDAKVTAVLLAALLVSLAFAVVMALSGCGLDAGKAAAMDSIAQAPGVPDTLKGTSRLSYQSIDTVVETPSLLEKGEDFLAALDPNDLLVSYAMDTAIDMSDCLGDYDHFVLANTGWIERVGDPERLSPVELSELPDELREFLEDQMSLVTATGEVVPDGARLCRYDGSETPLPALGMGTLLGMSDGVLARNALVLVVDDPASQLNAKSCLLSLTSSANVLFLDADAARAALDEVGLSVQVTLKPAESLS